MRVTGRVIALACVWSGNAEAAFAPREGRPYRYEVTETRTDDGVVRRFRATRSVVFRRVADGFEAVVTLESVDQDTAGSVGPMFEAAAAALLHRPIRYRLSPAGTPTDVTDADALVAAMADAIERIADGTENKARRAPASRALAAPLRSASPEHKRAMLLSILRPILFGAAADRAPGRRAVILPSRPPLPATTALTGTETVTIDGAVVTIALTATGSVTPSLAPNTPGTAFRPADAVAPGVTIAAVRTIDAATGLLLDGRETRDTVVPDTDGPHHALVETVIRVRATSP